MTDSDEMPEERKQMPSIGHWYAHIWERRPRMMDPKDLRDKEVSVIVMDTFLTHCVKNVFIPGGGRAATASAVKLGTVVSGEEEELLNVLLVR